MKCTFSKWALAGVLLMNMHSHAQPVKNAMPLDAALAAIVHHPATPLASLSVLAVRDGKVVYEKQFGSKWIDPTNPANPSNNKSADQHTLYRIASISKTITTLGVMKLVEDGKLKLDTDVSEYLGYTLRNPHFPDAAITLRMLLNHTSTLRDDAGYYWDANSNVDLQDVLLPGGRLHGKGAMWASNKKPGEYFQYANLPWGVVGSIMERATNERFDRLMRRLILEPMALPGGFHPADMSAADLANVATLYRKRSDINGKEVWNPAGPWVAQVDDHSKTPPVPRANPGYVIGSNGTLFGPQGNCRLSAQGLAHIMLMLMNKGQHNGKPILAEKTVEMMLAPQWRHNGLRGLAANGDNYKGQFHAWALGTQIFLDVSDVGKGDRLIEGGGVTGVGHFGDAWGLTSLMVFDRTTRNGMIFLSGGPGFNSDTTPGKYSSMPRYEEQILTALHRYAIRGDHEKITKVQ